jgi:hypothetical protein
MAARALIQLHPEQYSQGEMLHDPTLGQSPYGSCDWSWSSGDKFGVRSTAEPVALYRAVPVGAAPPPPWPVELGADVLVVLGPVAMDVVVLWTM